MLEPFYTVTAIDASQSAVSGRAKTGAQTSYTASVMDAAGHLLSEVALYDEVTHSLQANLPDGTYVLVVRGFTHPQTFTSGIITSNPELRPMSTAAGSVEFTVEGHPVTGLRFALGPPPSASVHLRFLHNTINSVATANSVDPVSLNIDSAGGVPMNSG